MHRITYNANSIRPRPGNCESGDHGPAPYTADISQAARRNTAFRSAFWTGSHLQLTLMSIPVGEDIGAEVHRDTDQYIRVEEGRAIARTGRAADRLDVQLNLSAGDAIFVPAGTWHNILNSGPLPLKLSSVYAPPHHPRCTLHRTKRDAQET